MKKITLATLCGLCMAAALSATPVQDSYTLEGERNFAKALELMEGLAASEPRNYLAHLRAGWLAYLSGQYVKSEVFYRKALVIAPDSIEPRMGLMLPLMALGRYVEAETAGRSGMEKDPKNYTIRSRLAQIYYLSGQFAASEKMYGELSTDYPSDGEMLLGLGWAQLKQGKKPQAKETFGRAGQVLPGNPRVTEGLKAAE